MSQYAEKVIGSGDLCVYTGSFHYAFKEPLIKICQQRDASYFPGKGIYHNCPQRDASGLRRKRALLNSRKKIITSWGKSLKTPHGCTTHHGKTQAGTLLPFTARKYTVSLCLQTIQQIALTWRSQSTNSLFGGPWPWPRASICCHSTTKKNRMMTSAKEYSFRCIVSSLQRRDRDSSECSYSSISNRQHNLDTLDPWEDECFSGTTNPSCWSAIPPDFATSLSHQAVYFSWFLPHSFLPRFRKGQRRKLMLRDWEQADGEHLGPKASQHLLLPHRNSSRGQNWLRKEGQLLEAASPWWDMLKWFIIVHKKSLC